MWHCVYVYVCVCVCMCVFLSKFEFESHPPFTFLAAFPQKALSYPKGFHINTYTNMYTYNTTLKLTNTHKQAPTHTFVHTGKPTNTHTQKKLTK